MKKIDAILHPVRFKIIQQFLDGQNRTAKDLAIKLHNIPQATLYRHIDTLVKTDVLKIIEENQIRGTIEKVYSLNLSAVHLTKDDLIGLNKEDHLQLFMVFTAQLLRDFEEYLDQDDIDFERDGVGYRQGVLFLSDSEFEAFIADLKQVLQKYIQNTPNSDRRKRLISTIMMPVVEEEKDDDKK
ncbi:MAG TPA: helix-turn-helix domain-containing protein [Bacillus sp. (in: firmicutes)]|uniref:helix-turn-helix domain-containing protein n=1 Tax=Bacillus litorisediminis TaxID=2922713 RepID=UPI001FAB4E53|nr:helix-turn-helix domain-containing protein [Bacillus litorisediminis]HWO77212.1 helix-turn-helix domain-containing protein [Bacillus sp. (in: firmicutes)]